MWIDFLLIAAFCGIETRLQCLASQGLCFIWRCCEFATKIGRCGKHMACCREYVLFPQIILKELKMFVIVSLNSDNLHSVSCAVALFLPLYSSFSCRRAKCCVHIQRALSMKQIFFASVLHCTLKPDAWTLLRVRVWGKTEHEV